MQLILQVTHPNIELLTNVLKQKLILHKLVMLIGKKPSGKLSQQNALLLKVLIFFIFSIHQALQANPKVWYEKMVGMRLL